MKSAAFSPRDLADFVAEAKAGGCAGFNVTMPHKEAILPLLDELSPAAAGLRRGEHRLHQKRPCHRL